MTPLKVVEDAAASGSSDKEAFGNHVVGRDHHEAKGKASKRCRQGKGILKLTSFHIFVGFTAQIYHAYVDAAEQMLEEDVKANKVRSQIGFKSVRVILGFKQIKGMNSLR